MTAFIVIALAGVATYALRIAPIAILTRRAVSPAVDRALGYAGPAILGAMIATAVARGGGVAALVTPSPAVLAAVASGAVAWRTRSVLATTVVGVGIYGLLSALAG